MRVAVLCDYAEEHWPSMDNAASMLLDRFDCMSGQGVRATRIQPRMKRCFQKAFAGAATRNADRLVNRFWHYPRYARGLRSFDLFHVIDHSYAQLLHRLDAERTVVTCHDADTFRCLFEPAKEPRPYWFRAMARHTLRGLEKAAAIVCVSEATKRLLNTHGVAEPQRISVVPNGIADCYRSEADADSDADAARLLGAPDRIEILHVGSTIPRKRIDVLLHTFAQVREERRNVHLVRVGAPLTLPQQNLARQLQIQNSMTCLPSLPASLLAAVYRRAALVLVCSEAEGFGLPLAEAMACGTPVIASSIPALREVAGDAAVHCEVGAVSQWSETVLRLLEERECNPDAWHRRVALGRARAQGFSWDRNAAQTATIYRTLLARNRIG